ncbi:hypothetical protein ISF_07498 [Cordyceps fumosorosea ARSEF 2679]|uniref:Uncharacterized protein n=1 Tax=Cordyceps fumosorosea (strain ARSEF 2679) TaxID=1081104 RepID=A0A167P9L3_CORFA|nr:hypothetical protein ISF_07498 [Cordyceps fumosorosea ARSEF 2679]OAA56430.1 hypothetical protein ISF_07498 [Cordyceps fumosorosea ARSEF 2679]
MPRFDRTPLEQHSYTASSGVTETTQSPSISGAMYGAARLPAMGFTPSYSYNSPGWQPGMHPLDLGGISSAPMSAVWPQGSYAPHLPDTSVSLPSTPATIGLYQSPCQDQTSRQMPHLNTPPTSALSRSKMSSDDHTGKPQLKVETGSHGYFKENSSVIMKKWFSNTTSQIAPPQLYNVPPPVSLSSQESFNDISVSSDRKLRTTANFLHPARSDFSSQLSFTSAGDFSSQSPQAGYAGSRRLPNNSSPSPSFLRGPATQDISSNNSPSGGTSLAPSTHDSDSNYAASSAQPSSHQASRLPSPAVSDHHYYNNDNNDKDAQNAFLIEARAKGMSYKEIKTKGGFSEAESTLRGRHRMLTKDKESRVRKPEWTETDVSSPAKPRYPPLKPKTHST